MSYIGEKYYRVILILNYGLHLPEILELCLKNQGEFAGRKDDDKPITVYYDFWDKNEGKRNATNFIGEVRENYGRNIIRASVYPDWIYED